MIRTVFLDLDDTLLDFQKGERIALAKALDAMGIPYDDALVERYIEINLACWKALERGEMTSAEVLVGRFEMLFEEYKINASANEIQDIYQELLSHEHDFIPGGKELLLDFKKDGKYSLYMATNGIPAVQRPRIAASGIGEFFKDIFISYDLGYGKPKKEFFDGCFERIENFKKEECIIVGDSLTSDIKGGINAGIKTCHFNRLNLPYTDIKPDYKINYLSELIPLLDSIE